MKPKELLLKCLEDYLVDEMKNLGFKYSKSVPKFTRENGMFELSFSFAISKWSLDDNCEFWTMWGVTSKDYSKWFKEQWGVKPNNNAITGDAEWNIPNWTRDVSNHFHLNNSNEDIQEMNELICNIKNMGIPYYEKINSWDKAVQSASQDTPTVYSKICDFYLISGQKEKAKDILEQGIRVIQSKGLDQLFQLPEIKKRLERYFL
jgi:hypothetical protein